MIIDLNLKGKQVVIVGGGREAERKAEALFSQDCEIVIICARAGDKISQWGKEGRLTLKLQKVSDGNFLTCFDRLILVMAATDDIQLNREIVAAAKSLRCYAYSVDDPEFSDFSHPAIINLGDTVQIAVSTGGRSPTMAKDIKRRLEPVLKEWIGREDILKIQLQARIRKQAQTALPSPQARKQFFAVILSHDEINLLLDQDKLDDAEALALKLLQVHS